MRAILASVAVLALVGFACADDDDDEKIDAKKLIGKWEPTKAEDKAVLEIKDKGKLVLSVTINEKTQQIEGTYKLDGNKLEVELTFGDNKIKETLTIIKLSDKEMTTKDSKGKEETMKKVK
jgi:uncharacterized protein (TIGR03066 family)